VRATTDIEVLRLDRGVFHALVAEHPRLRGYLELHARRAALRDLFRVHSEIRDLPMEAMERLLRELEPVSVARDECALREGDEAEALYIVEKGRLRAFTAEGGSREYRAYYRRGDFFGERALMRGEPHGASIEAIEPSELLRLPRATFEALLLESPEFAERVRERAAQFDYRTTARVPLDFADEMLPAEAVKAQPDASAEAVDDSANAPFETSDGLFGKRKERIRHFDHVRQIDEMDCGAASLAMVCRHFGRKVQLSRIRQLVHAGQDGTSLRAICSGASSLGLAARAAKASPRTLDDMPLPAIMHWRGNHWIVLYHIDEQHAWVADPASTCRRITRAELEADWSGYVALFDYTEAFEEAPEGESSTTWLLPFLRPHLPLLARGLGLALVASGLQMVFPVFTQVVVDRVLVEHDVTLLQALVLAMAAVVVFMFASIYVQRYLLSFAAMRIDASTLDFLTRRLLALPMSYFSSRRTGDIQRRLEGARSIREFLVSASVQGISALTQLAAALTVMLLYSPALTGVFLLMTPVYAFLMYYSARRLRPLYASLEEEFGRYHSGQIDAIKGIETVKSLGAEGGLRERLLEQFHVIATHSFRADLTMLSYQGAVQSVTFVTTLLILWVGAKGVMAGDLTIGAFVAFNALVALAQGPVSAALGLWDDYQLSVVLLDRLADIFDSEPEQGFDHSELTPVRTLEGHVDVRGLSFRYGGPEAPEILRDIDLRVPAGRRVAIVGRSGSGKTTLAKCLAGLLEPTGGQLLFDHLDSRTLSLADLRKQIGFVLQDSHLFDDSIARNIAFGEVEPDMDRVMWAAQIANARDFVERLPLGYDTRVGETGLAISGGQAQRIAIARAVYHRPAVLIFDEATSSLDTESERAVQQNMDRMLEGRTAFVIAHRLSTIRNSDLIVVLEKGSIVEQGTHDELIDREGLYYYLCSQQLEL
jgi:ATP-binding cassette subfamily B protein